MAAAYSSSSEKPAASRQCFGLVGPHDGPPVQVLADSPRFITTGQVEAGKDHRPIQEALYKHFAVPSWFWTSKMQTASGYYSGTGTSDSQYITVSHFLIKYVKDRKLAATGLGRDGFYDWHKQSFITAKQASGKPLLICFNVPEIQQTNLMASISSIPIADLESHPFAFHGLILEHIVSLYDSAIWSFRDFVREQERQRPTIAKPEPDYIGMHELARHVMHSSEVSNTALNVIDSILDDLARYEQSHQTHHSSSTTLDPSPEIRRQRSLLQCFHLRSRALEERLRNEINLAFHIASQHDSLIQAQIARASQVDSNATRTISILGLLFLPGTFISAVFSMSFFNFSPATETAPAEWRISDKFWVYWVVAIPVTAMTVAVWWYWQRSTVVPASKRSTSSLARDHIIPIHPPQDPKAFTF